MMCIIIFLVKKYYSFDGWPHSQVHPMATGISPMLFDSIASSTCHIECK